MREPRPLELLERARRIDPAAWATPMPRSMQKRRNASYNKALAEYRADMVPDILAEQKPLGTVATWTHPKAHHLTGLERPEMNCRFVHECIADGSCLVRHWRCEPAIPLPEDDPLSEPEF